MPRFVPFFSEAAWRTMKEKECSPGIHAGLALYRFFEGPLDDEKKKRNLRLIQNITFPEGTRLLVERQERQLQALAARGFETSRFEMKTVERLACGLGIASSAENGLYLDRIHGLPCIPGPSLKGVAQDQALMERGVFLARTRRQELRRMDGEFVAVFGAQSAEQGETLDRQWEARKGHVLFLDGVPVLSPCGQPFEIEIMNPHYGEYYSERGAKPPADYLAPTPIFFITVKKGVTFSFALAARQADFVLKGRRNAEAAVTVKIDADQLLAKAKTWLVTRLEDFGVGGKTRVGYGRLLSVAEAAARGGV